MVIFYKYIYTHISLYVPGALYRSSVYLDWLGWGHTHLSSLLLSRPSSSSDHLPSRFCPLEPRMLVCGDSHVVQHWWSLSNSFSLFILLIWGTDLHCDARPCLSCLTLGMEDGVEMNSRNRQSQEQSVRNLSRKGGEQGEGETHHRIPPRGQAGPLSSTGVSFPTPYLLRHPISSCLPSIRS